ncbi:MAG: nucleotidyl transferase AbiEii/AbiGii toxin family protein [Gammaproteobacteria bacterium]
MNNLSELDVLKDVISRLESTGLDYMLTGSLAMNYYAQPRMTRDIDIVVALERNDVSRIVETFGNDYYVSEEAVTSAVNDAAMFNLMHLESVVKVDIIVRKTDKYRQHEFSRRLPVMIADFTTWIVSREDLILSKLHWARDSMSEMQLNDVKNLLATSPDMEYLNQWAEDLGVRQLLEECQGE